MLLMAAPLHAQGDGTRAAMIRQLYPGTKLRLTISDQPLISEFVRAAPDSIFLSAGAFALSDVQSLEVQQRATRRGAKIGAVIGAPAGAGFGAFIMLIATYMCEYECSDNKARDVTLGTLGFAAFGAAAGATIGAVVGAATPDWMEITDPRVRLPKEGRAKRTIGSFALTPAYARYADIDAAGPGVRVAYTFHAGPVAFGPEFGTYQIANERGIRHAGGIARIGTGRDKRIEPYGSLGVGFYSWNRDFGAIQLGGYSAGGGIHLRSADAKRSVFTEARWQDNLTNSGDANPQFGFYTIGIGATIAW